MTISIVNPNNPIKLQHPSKVSSTISIIKKSPSSDPNSIIGDFEEISLSTQNPYARDSINDSLRDSLSTTVSSSPNYFSDVSSTKSSDSSDEGELSSANTSGMSANSSTSSTNSDSTIDSPNTSPTFHKLPTKLPISDSRGYTRKPSRERIDQPVNVQSHSVYSVDHRGNHVANHVANHTINQSANHSANHSIPSTKQHQLQKQLSPTSSSMTSNRPLTDDLSFVHKRLARQRSIGGNLHRSNAPPNTVRRASTGTTQPNHPNHPNHPIQPNQQPKHSPRKSTPLLRKALSSSHLQNGLGIYPMAEPTPSTIKPKLKPLRTRLSSDQLELQYDHDENIDFEIPDNAIMWNVPLSPALYAKSRQNSLEKNAIPSTEPLNIAPRASKHRSNHNSPDISTLPSIKESEPVLYSSTGLENLSKDAQDLTIALVQSPNDIDRRTSGGSSSTSSSRRQSLRRVSSTSSFGDTVTSDLSHYSLSSKTRPNGLPPKSLDEEQKHLKEFSKILQQAAVADKKRLTKRESEVKLREKQREKDELQWKNKIIPNLDESSNSPLTRELWWRGIPSKYREQVWKQQIGNKLNITNEVYTQCLAEASRSLTPQIHQAIASDTRSTFTEFQIFGENGPLHNDLVNIIKAYAIYRPKVGYKPTITSMTAILLLNMSTPLDAFIALSNMLENSLTMALLTGDDRTVTSYYTSFLKVLNTKLSSLYRHFQQIQLPPSAYLEPMLSSQFTNHLSIDIVHRIWDILVFEGDAFLLRVALGVILTIEHRLYTTSSDIIAQLGYSIKSEIDVGEEDSFMQAVRDCLKA